MLPWGALGKSEAVRCSPSIDFRTPEKLSGFHKLLYQKYVLLYSTSSVAADNGGAFGLLSKLGFEAISKLEKADQRGFEIASEVSTVLHFSVTAIIDSH